MDETHWIKDCSTSVKFASKLHFSSAVVSLNIVYVTVLVRVVAVTTVVETTVEMVDVMVVPVTLVTVLAVWVLEVNVDVVWVELVEDGVVEGVVVTEVVPDDVGVLREQRSNVPSPGNANASRRELTVLATAMHWLAETLSAPTLEHSTEAPVSPAKLARAPLNTGMLMSHDASTSSLKTCDPLLVVRQVIGAPIEGPVAQAWSRRFSSVTW